MYSRGTGTLPKGIESIPTIKIPIVSTIGKTFSIFISSRIFYFISCI